jgi:hypothetical protein
MDIVAVTISSSSMQLETETGLYYGTILAEQHNFGVNAFVVRAVYRNSNLELDNVLCSYKVLPTGDIRIYVDEPVSLRITVGRGVPVETNSILGEGEENADY